MEKSVSTYTLHQVLISMLNRHSHGTTGALTNVKILLHLKINIRNAKGMQPHARP